MTPTAYLILAFGLVGAIALAGIIFGTFKIVQTVKFRHEVNTAQLPDFISQEELPDIGINGRERKSAFSIEPEDVRDLDFSGGSLVDEADVIVMPSAGDEKPSRRRRRVID